MSSSIENRVIPLCFLPGLFCIQGKQSYQVVDGMTKKVKISGKQTD